MFRIRGSGGPRDETLVALETISVPLPYRIPSLSFNPGSNLRDECYSVLDENSGWNGSGTGNRWDVDHISNTLESDPEGEVANTYVGV